MKNYFLIPLLAIGVLACKKEPSEEVVPVPEKRLTRIEVNNSGIKTNYTLSYNSDGKIDSIITIDTYENGKNYKGYSSIIYENNLVKTIKRAGEQPSVVIPSGPSSSALVPPNYYEEFNYSYSGLKLINCTHNKNYGVEMIQNYTLHYDEKGKLDYYVQGIDTLRAERDLDGLFLYWNNKAGCRRNSYVLTDNKREFYFCSLNSNCDFDSGDISGKYTDITNSLPDVLWDHIMGSPNNVTSDIMNFIMDEVESEKFLQESIIKYPSHPAITYKFEYKTVE